MQSCIIANPPCGIYKGDLPLGYAYYQTLLDIHTRFLKVFKGLDPICPKYSLNALGKRAENLGLNGTAEDLDRYVQEWIEKGELRDRMNFSFSGNVLDTSKESMCQTKEAFQKLYEKGYILRDGNTFYLNTGKIKEDFDLTEIAQEIHFFSNRSRIEFMRLIHDLPKAIRVTKERVYSVQNPLGGEGIAPIFGVSNLWEGYFDSEIELMASSEMEVARYIILRFLCQIPLSKNLPMKNVLVYNYINPEGGFDDWHMDKLTETGVASDSLRYSFAKSLSLSEQKVELKRDLLKGGEKLIYLVGNLKKLFLKEGYRLEVFQDANDDNYIDRMGCFKYSGVLSDIEINLRHISTRINKSKESGNFQIEGKSIFREYLYLVKSLSPFCPFISQKVLNDLSTI